MDIKLYMLLRDNNIPLSKLLLDQQFQLSIKIQACKVNKLLEFLL